MILYSISSVTNCLIWNNMKLEIRPVVWFWACPIVLLFWDKWGTDVLLSHTQKLLCLHCYVDHRFWSDRSSDSILRTVVHTHTVLFLQICFMGILFKNTSTKWVPQKTKNVVLKKFLEQTTLKPCNFWAGEALEAQRRDYLNITSAQKWHSDIFQISVDKSFQAW